METATRSLNLKLIKYENADFVIIKKNAKEILLPNQNFVPSNNSSSIYITEDKSNLYLYLKSRKNYFIPTFRIKHPKFNKKEVSSLIQAMNYLSLHPFGVIIKSENHLYFAGTIDQIENAWLALFKQNYEKILISPYYETLNEWRIFIYKNKIFSCVRKQYRKTTWRTNMQDIVEEGDLMVIANNLKPMAIRATTALNLEKRTNSHEVLGGSV